MKNIFQKLLMLSVLSASPMAIAQSGSHGGYVMDCEGLPLMMLDYYEATKTLSLIKHSSEGHEYQASSFGGLHSLAPYPKLNAYADDQLVHKFLEYIFNLRKGMNSNVATLEENFVSPAKFKAFYHALKQNINLLGPVESWKEEQFKADEDSNHLVNLVAGCKVYQGLQRRGNQVFILPGLKNRLDTKQKEIAQLHEAIFKTGIEEYHHSSSALTRAIIGVFLKLGVCNLNDGATYMNCNLAAARFMANDEEYIANSDHSKVQSFTQTSDHIDFSSTPISTLDFVGKYKLVPAEDPNYYQHEFSQGGKKADACPDQIDFKSTPAGDVATVNFITGQTVKSVTNTPFVIHNLYYGGFAALDEMNQVIGKLPVLPNPSFQLFSGEGRKVGLYFEENPSNYFLHSLFMNAEPRQLVIKTPTIKFTANENGGLIYENWDTGNPFTGLHNVGYFQRCFYSKVLDTVPPVKDPVIPTRGGDDSYTRVIAHRPVRQVREFTIPKEATSLKITLEDGAINDGDVVGTILGNKSIFPIVLKNKTVVYDATAKTIQILVYGINEGSIPPITVDCVVQWVIKGEMKSSRMKLQLSEKENSILKIRTE